MGLTVGDAEGSSVGLTVGEVEGEADGEAEGSSVGLTVGDDEGEPDGEAVVGIGVGTCSQPHKRLEVGPVVAEQEYSESSRGVIAYLQDPLTKRGLAVPCLFSNEVQVLPREAMTALIVASV